jgi:DNA replication protein DnaC
VVARNPPCEEATGAEGARRCHAYEQTCATGRGGLCGPLTTAVDARNHLAGAEAAQRLKAELKRYLMPAVLVLDVLGYLLLDKTGADLLFHVISQRYERGSLIITTNKVCKSWAEIFN